MAKFSEYSQLFREPVKPDVNRITSHLTADIWDMIKQKLTSDVGMIILPIDAYGNSLTMIAMVFRCKYKQGFAKGQFQILH